MESAAHTPVLQDKSFWLSVATVASILVLDVFGVHVSPETLMTVGGLVASFVVSSKAKQASVLKAEAVAAGKAAASSVGSLEEAAKILETK